MKTSHKDYITQLLEDVRTVYEVDKAKNGREIAQANFRKQFAIARKGSKEGSHVDRKRR